MPALRIGLQVAGLRQPLSQALLTAARLGAGAVEIDARNELRPAEMTGTGVRQLRKMLDDLNLRVAAVAFPTHRGYDTVADLDRRIAATKDAMRLAYALGAPVVVNNVGRIPPPPAEGESERPEWTTLLEALADLGRFGQHVGALLAAATGGESGADLSRLLAALPPGAIGIDLNPGRLVASEFSPLEVVAAVGTSILHVHATDGVRNQSQRGGVEVQLGRGSVDYPALLGALEEHGYRGWHTIERRHAADPEREFEQAISYLRRL